MIQTIYMAVVVKTVGAVWSSEFTTPKLEPTWPWVKIQNVAVNITIPTKIGF